MHGLLSLIWSGCLPLVSNCTVHYHTYKSTYPCNTTQDQPCTSLALWCF